VITVPEGARNSIEDPDFGGANNDTKGTEIEKVRPSCEIQCKKGMHLGGQQEGDTVRKLKATVVEK